MPEYTDISGATLSIDVNLQEAKNFLKFQDGFVIYEPSDEVPNQGDYVVMYSVSSNGQKKDFYFTVRVTCSSFVVYD